MFGVGRSHTWLRLFGHRRSGKSGAEDAPESVPRFTERCCVTVVRYLLEVLKRTLRGYSFSAFLSNCRELLLL